MIEQPQGDTEDSSSYEVLRDQILEGILMPNQRLVETDIMELLGVKRWEVRAIFTRLEQDGLLVRERNRGVRVRHIERQEAIDLLEIQDAIACLVVKKAAVVASPSELANIENILARMCELHAANELLPYAALNMEMLQAIISTARSTPHQELHGSLNTRLIRSQYRAIFTPNRMDKSLSEHKAIVAALVARDPDAAAAAMHLHYLGVIAAVASAPPHEF